MSNLSPLEQVMAAHWGTPTEPIYYSLGRPLGLRPEAMQWQALSGHPLWSEITQKQKTRQ